MSLYLAAYLLVGLTSTGAMEVPRSPLGYVRIVLGIPFWPVTVLHHLFARLYRTE
jgi:hypothetical protein